MSQVDHITIDPPCLGQAPCCDAIMRALPDWFGIESAIVHFKQAIESLPTVVARDGDQAVGFMALKEHFPTSADLYVLGIRPEYHRQGIGKRMLDAAEDWLRARGTRFLQVKTVAESRDCKFYAQSRLWYLAMGFEPLEVFPTLWDEANPCLLLIKYLPEPDSAPGTRPRGSNP